MSPYDSDSSSDDGANDVQTNVTLGYVTADATGDEISHVGGHPSFLDKDTPPPATFSRCKICDKQMSLLIQLQADLSQHFPGDQRRLHVWCCRKRQCSRRAGSIRAYREVKKAPKREKKTSKPLVAASASNFTQDLGSQLFGGSAPIQNTNVNPFSPSTPTTSANANKNPFSSGRENPFSSSELSSLAAKPAQSPAQEPLTTTFADKLKITSESDTTTSSGEGRQPWPPETSFPSPFPHFYLDAEAEYLEPEPSISTNGESSNSRIMDLDEPGSTPAADKDLYESPHDKTFDLFTRRLAQNQEQVLRYEFRGNPLLYNSTDAVAACFVTPHAAGNAKVKVRASGPARGIPSCQSCGSARVFEMQLVPNLIFEVEKDDDEAMQLDGNGMEWGTILVGTCASNCGEDGIVTWREEWCGVQWEEQGEKK